MYTDYMIYFQWWNSSDTFVIAIVFLFIPPWPHKWPKHLAGYPVITLHQNTIVYSLVLILYSLN